MGPALRRIGKSFQTPWPALRPCPQGHTILSLPRGGRWQPGDWEEVGTLSLTGVPEVGSGPEATHTPVPLALLPGQPDDQSWR